VYYYFIVRIKIQEFSKIIMSLLGLIFGNNTASVTDTVNESINAMASVVNDAVQNCTQQVNQTISQDISVSNANIGQLNLTNDQIASLKASCLQSNTSVEQLKQDMSSAASQVAKAVGQQFQLSGSKANVVANLYTNVGESIVNKFVQDCSTQTNQQIQQNITIGAPGGRTEIGVVNLANDQVSIDFINCSARGSTTTALSQQIVDTIQQEAEAKIESFFGPIIIAIAIILGIIILILFVPLAFGSSRRQTQSGDGNGLKSTLLALGALSPDETGSAADVPASASTQGSASQGSSGNSFFDTASSFFSGSGSGGESSGAKGLEGEAKGLGSEAKGLEGDFGKSSKGLERGFASVAEDV
jgi:hypothetical protein